MKLNILTTAALLAMAVALTTQSAKAQFNGTGTGTAGDLILGFNTGTGTDFEIDLGGASQFVNATSTVNIVDLNADLTSAYGSSWYSNTNLEVGILGAKSLGLSSKDVWASDSSATPYSAIAEGTLAGILTNVSKLYTPNLDTNNLPTDGSAAGSFDVPAGSLYSLKTVTGLVSSAVPNFEVTFNGSTNPKLYLDQLIDPSSSSSSSTYPSNGGFFDITSGGELQYTIQTQSVPEPSTYALMILGGAILFVWQARRKSVSSL